jgi:ATP diphosphatase
MTELRGAVAAKDADAVEDELGDLLFMAVNLARHLNVNPDAALSRACAKFEARFRRVEDAAAAKGFHLNECSLKDLDTLWNQAKEILSRDNRK